MLATHAIDGTTALWDVFSGHVLHKLLKGGQLAVVSLAFSGDGRQVMAAVNDASGRESRRQNLGLAIRQAPRRGQGAQRYSLHGDEPRTERKWPVCRTERELFGRGQEPPTASVAVWDAKTGSPMQALEESSASIFSAMLSADGNLLATSDYDSTATLWDTQTGKKLQTLQRHTQQINAEAFSRDGRLLATGSQDCTAILWDTQTGERVLTLLGRGPTDNVTAVAFSPDGHLVATGGNQKVVLWNTQTGEAVRTLSGHNLPILSVLLSPDGKQIATVCNRTAVFWDTAKGKRTASLSGAECAGLNALAFSPDGNQAITTSQQMETAQWDTRTGQKIRGFEGYRVGVGSGAAVSPDGKEVAVLSAMGNIVFWDAQSGAFLRTIPETPGAAAGGQGPGGQMRINPGYYGAPSEQFSSLAFSADGKQMLTGPANNGTSTALWEIKTMKKTKSYAGENNMPVFGATFRPGGKEIAAISYSGEVIFWDAQTGRKLRSIKPPPPAAENPATAAANAIQQREAQMIAMRIRQQQRRMMAMQYDADGSPMGGMASFAFSPDGKQIAIGTAADSSALWNAQTGEKIRPLKGHCRRLSAAPSSARMAAFLWVCMTAARPEFGTRRRAIC